LITGSSEGGLDREMKESGQKKCEKGIKKK
jgi:hypothetical protein